MTESSNVRTESRRTFRPTLWKLSPFALAVATIPLSSPSQPLVTRIVPALVAAAVTMVALRYLLSVSIEKGMIAGPRDQAAWLRCRIPVADVTLGPGHDWGPPKFSVASSRNDARITVFFMSKRSRWRLLQTLEQLSGRRLDPGCPEQRTTENPTDIGEI